MVKKVFLKVHIIIAEGEFNIDIVSGLFVLGMISSENHKGFGATLVPNVFA